MTVRGLLIAVCAASLGGSAFATNEVGRAGGDLTVSLATPEALTQAAPSLNEADRPAFFRGRNLFRQVWVVALAQDAEVDGLGPVFNRLSCLACHAKNGRGFAPERPGEEMRAMLVRLSIPGAGPHGAPLEHPRYGDQFNELGIPGVPGEGRAFLRYETRSVTLAEGETVELRKPVIEFRDLQFGPLGVDVMTSLRIAPAVHGLGLLEAVPEATLLALAARSGRPNRVWNAREQRITVGRFGAKANQPDLRQQVAAAFHGDLGITSTLFPEENCAPVQSACRAATNGGSPELSDDQLADLVFYLELLAVPARRHADDSEVQAGEAAFTKFGCATCHVPRLTTGEHASRPELSHQAIQPYTDLLLHDMGDDLADGRPDFAATGREWRTAPLWGIGLAKVVDERAGFLHDGRARTLLEAILWHGGEAQAARESVSRAPRTEREALLRFLESL